MSHKLIIPLLILALIFSYGCFQKEAEPEGKTTEELSSEDTETSTTEDILNKEPLSDQQTSEEKTEIYKEAQKTLDPAKCDEIEHPLSKKNCKQNIIIKEAIQKQDSTLCDTLEGEGDKEYCKKRIGNQ